MNQDNSVRNRSGKIKIKLPSGSNQAGSRSGGNLNLPPPLIQMDQNFFCCPWMKIQSVRSILVRNRWKFSTESALCPQSSRESGGNLKMPSPITQGQFENALSSITQGRFENALSSITQGPI